MRGNPWTKSELSLLDGFARAGLAASECWHLFPDRSEDAVHCKLASRRKRFGIRKPIGRPKKDALRPKAIPGLIAMPEAPERLITIDTPEGRASRELLRRQLVTGKHWITDPSKFAQVCQSVGLAA